MDNITVQRARDLDVPARQWLEGLFGRSLREDEEVTIHLSVPHPAPTEAERKAALTRIETVLDRAADNMRDVPAATFEAAVDEAMAHVRRRKS
jgi:hypothetical protein